VRDHPLGHRGMPFILFSLTAGLSCRRLVFLIGRLAAAIEGGAAKGRHSA